MAGPRRGFAGDLQATRLGVRGSPPVSRSPFDGPCSIHRHGAPLLPRHVPVVVLAPVENVGVISADIPSKEEEPLPYLIPLCNHSPALRRLDCIVFVSFYLVLLRHDSCSDIVMGVGETSYGGMLCSIFLLFALPWCFAHGLEANQSALLTVDASPQSGQKVPDTLFGIFFELVAHVSIGFEAGGPNTPSNIDPWSIIGQESFIYVSTDRTSCFPRNEVALRMEVLCDNTGSVICPSDGVGIYNPGYWGMNIEQGKTYKLILYVRSLDSINISVSLTSSDGLQKLASGSILADASNVSNWTRVELLLESVATNRNSRLQLTTTNKGVVWFDQVSLMPSDTYKGHGFRKELVSMIEDMKPRFIRFPGGSYVEGEWLRNAFRWRETIGPWEERPGHFGDVWMYWTDDGLGYLEYLQVGSR
ncbi:Alpha-L-arabinofuranosidase C-terminus family protein [Musa troglodytarum]|uniref:Alpha-L-arabinofuranosidase C-terminus family protein n=1 Tax=Musa troglodytarum TaxID=320322 RepID=A0A9E7HYQ4_9LILI|nr:Alpha-L-arabinofuranosidase C-terminus family protein [Musa troglodytarum]